MIYIESTTTFVQNYLHANRIGTVHSVYERTINLQFENQLIALQSSGSPVSPISVVLPITGIQMNEFSVRQGDSCTIRDGQITLGDKHVFIDCRTIIYNPTLSATLIDSDFLSAIRQLAEQSHRNGFIRILLQYKEFLSDPVLDHAITILEKSRSALLDDNDAGACAELIRLIGLGGGLTPGGDDFLCGVLAATTVLGDSVDSLREELADSISHSLPNTNDISAAFLQCAAAGMFSQPVLKLFRDPHAAGLVDDFLAIGHTSGFDTVAGILWMLQIFEELGVVK